MPEGVDALWCLRQIEGYQIAKRKLPRWSATSGLWYPPKLSMEQCSSEATARYKQGIVQRLTEGTDYSFMDITGGFGVDFSYMAIGASNAVYVERQEVLCEAARHNMPLLGLQNAEIVNGDSTELLKRNETREHLIIYADPARRDDAGRKTVAIEDCTPDICSMQDELLSRADYLIVKLSPMLDITQALRSLHNVREVHVVSVKGECKELLFVLSSVVESVAYHCINLDTPSGSFVCTSKDVEEGRAGMLCQMPETGMTVCEPNASILKAGCQESFAHRYDLRKLHPMSNLYIANENAEKLNDGLARCFRIMALYDFSKSSLKQLQKEIKQANLAIRNFPSTVAELRRRLKIKEGGSKYIFATTLYDGSHALLLCEKL